MSVVTVLYGRTRKKKKKKQRKMFSIFLCFFIELKTHHLSYSIYKHDAIHIADPLRVIYLTTTYKNI